ncbi:MAG: hypothetical protein WAL56_24465 [Candidatus Sulfotelmatobacter sp.]
MEPIFDIEGLPELNARLDKIATLIAGLIAREALQAGGKIIKGRAMENVHKKNRPHSRTISQLSRACAKRSLKSTLSLSQHGVPCASLQCR